MESEESEHEILVEGQMVAGRYRVHRLLGKGGFGAVYEAEHVGLGKRIAIKVLLPKLAANAGVIQRFVREARAAASIGHPGVVEVFDVGAEDGLAYIAMEKLEGEELFDRIQREHPLDPSFVARVGIEIADAMSAAHEHGIVHRDLKPQNVFLTHRGRQRDVVKVLDFGIAKLADAERADVPLTQTGQVIGTPLYMSPSQLRAEKDLDGREDVYAIGAMLYEALAGRPPFVAETYAALIVMICSEDPRPLTTVRPDVPPALAEIVARAMHRDRTQRLQSARALVEALEGFLAGRDTLPRRAPPATMPAELAQTMPSGTTPTGLTPSTPMPGGSTPMPVGATTPMSETPFASESMRPPASRPGSSRGLVIGGVIAVLMAGGVGVAWTTGLFGGGEPERAVLGDGAAQPPPPGPVDPPETPPEPVRPELTTPEPTRAPETKTVLFDVRPLGASVEVAGQPACRSPCSLTLPLTATTARFTLRGFAPGNVTLTPPFQDRIEHRLARARRAGAGPGPGPGPGQDPGDDIIKNR